MAAVVAISPWWWAFVVRGVAAVLFGMLTFIVPGMALLTLVFLFGAYAIVEGAFNIAAAVHRGEPRRQPAWVLALEGVVSIVAGLLAYVLPGLTALSLLLLIAAWSLVTGVLEIAAAIRLRRQVKGEWLMALSGVLSVVFGFLLMVFPGAGALAVVLWIGAYAIPFGAILIALGVKLRRWTRADRPHTGFGALAPSASR
jgi:uncharacterized membrane protein HdeD (DUF308 family)